MGWHAIRRTGATRPSHQRSVDATPDLMARAAAIAKYKHGAHAIARDGTGKWPGHNGLHGQREGAGNAAS
jgi:hypothetical protein